MSLAYTALSDGELAALSIAGRQVAFAEIMRRFLAEHGSGDPWIGLDVRTDGSGVLQIDGAIDLTPDEVAAVKAFIAAH